MDTGVRLREKTKKLYQALKGVSHEHRLAIIYLLAHKDMEEREIVSNLDMPQNLVAHHLKIMLDHGWVKKTKGTKFVTYHLQAKALDIFNKLLEDTPIGRKIFS